MVSTLISFSALFIANLTLMAGLGLLGTFLSVRLTVQGYASQTIGLVMGAYFLGLIVGSVVCQRLILRVGHIRSFAAFAAVTTSIAMLHGLYLSPVAWAVFRLLSGVAAIGLTMVIESWLNECTETHARGRVFSIYLVSTYLGITIGQQFINVYEITSDKLFFVAGILLALSLVPVAVTHSISPRLPTMERVRFSELFRRSPVGMLGCLTAGLINGAFYALGPVFALKIGLTISQVSWFMTAAIFGGLVLQWPVGLVSDRFDRTKVLATLGVLLAIVSSGVIMIAHVSYPGFLMGMGLFGGVIFTIYPVAVARAHDLFEPGEIIPVSSGLLLAFSIGAAAGPVAASSAMAATGTPYGFFGYGIVIGLVYAFVTFYLRRKESVAIIPVEEQVDFVPMKETSTVAMMFDPRTDTEAQQTDGVSEDPFAKED
jgi:MFS family permease